MTERKACFLLSAGALAAGGIVLAAAMLAPISGMVLGVFFIVLLGCLGLALASFTAALQAHPGQALEDNIFLAIVDILTAKW